MSPAKMRARIHELEQRLTAFTGLVSDLIWQTDSELRLTAISEHIVDTLGFAPSELIGRSVLDIGSFDDEESEDSAKAFHRPFRNRRFRMIDKQGQPHTFRVSSNPVLDPTSGAFKGAHGTADDDTLRRAADLALRDGERRYRLLVERSPQAMLVLQQGGGIQYANAAALKMFAATRVEELADRAPLDLVHSDDHERVRERRRYWLANLDTADYFELRRLTVDGRPFHSANYANVIEWEGERSLLISIIDITDYRNAQAALAESEHRFRDFAQSAADRFWETDELHRIIFTSQPRDRAILTGEASSMGRLRWDIPALDPTDPKWEQLRRDMTEHLPIRNFRYRFSDSSGRMRYMRMNGVPVIDTAGAFRGYRGTTIDETAEMLARQEAEDREKLLRLTTESVPAFIAYHDRDMRFRYANSFYKHIGWDPEKLIGRTIQEVFGSGFASSTGPFQRVALDGKVVRHENELPTTDGRVLLTESTLIPDVDVAGEVVGFFVMALDVTERKQAERERERNRRSLEAAQRLGHIGSFERFFSSEETFWTDEAYRIFGRDPGAGMSYQHFIEQVHPHDRGRVHRVIEKAIRTRYRSFAQEFRIVRPDGNERVIAATGEIDYDAEGNPRSMLGSLQDITDHKRAQEALEQAKQEAETASRAKTEFLSSMSHELRTPMNAVLGYAQLLLQNKKEPVTQRQRRQINQILKSGQHLLNLINDILDLSRIEAGRIDLELKHVPLDRMVRECMSLMTTLAERNSVTMVDKTLGKKPMIALCDEVRLKQALLNLISNAIKFNRTGGTVSLEWEERHDGAIRVSIEDTGDGIPEERWGELFEPFSRLDATQRGIEGTGIGLAISKQLVERMGGHIGFTSEMAKGSTFWIELPQAPTDDEDAVEPDESLAEPTEPAFRLAYDQPSTLLYIEDDASNLQLVDEVISHIPNLQLLSAPDAESGLEIAKAERPQVIVMDINLPGMNGFEALSRLKRDPETAAIPVIALSAAAMAKDIQKGLAAGFFSYLTKPFVIDDLLGTVDRALSGAPGPSASS